MKQNLIIIKKTNNNVFISLIKNNKTKISISFYTFIKKNKKNAYKLFWYRLFSFLTYRTMKFNITELNFIFYGKLIFSLFKLSKNKRFLTKISRFIYYTGNSHNGCRLKKKRRK